MKDSNDVFVDIDKIGQITKKIPVEDFADTQFDMFGVAEVTDILVIFSTPRSGSTYLCELLYKSGVCLAHEYFQPFEYLPTLAHRWGCVSDGVVDKEKYLRELVDRRTSPNGWLGINLHGQHIEVYTKFLAYLPKVKVHYVNLVRNNSLAQAVSYEIAMQTGKWSSYFDSIGEAEYSFDRVKTRLDALHRENDLINSFLVRQKIVIKTVTYENLMSDPLAAIKAIIPKGVGDLASMDVSLQKQASDSSKVWINEFAREYLASNRLSNTGDVKERAEKSMSHKTKILFITNVPPEPISGGSKRAFSTISALCELGCDVVSFSHKKMERAKPHLELLSARYPDFSCKDNVGIDNSFDVLWVSCQWSIEEVQYAVSVVKKFKKNTENSRVVVDLSDVLVEDFKGKYPTDSPAHKEIEKYERALLHEADVAVWVSEVEREKAIKLYSLDQNRTYIIPSCHLRRSSLVSKKFNQRLKAVCLAGSAHPHNINSFNVAIKRIWPLIRKLVPDAELHIFGSGTGSLNIEPKFEDGIRILGFVEDFGAQMENYRAHLVPTVTGGGVKTKIFESLTVGTPIVGSLKSLEGTGIESECAAFVSSSIDALAERTINLLTDQSVWEQANQEAIKLSEQVSDLSDFAAIVSEVLDGTKHTKEKLNLSLDTSGQSMENNLAKIEGFYGQGGEDYLLWALLKKSKVKFFVDVGAFDGKHLSNSYYFEKKGWSGICVEAHPKYFPICKSNRPESICVNAACVGNSAGKYVNMLIEELGLLSGIKADQTKDMNGRYAAREMNFDGFASVRVPALTLNEILEFYVPNQRDIDFVSIDTEGTELEILTNFDFQKYRVKVFVIEANDAESERNIAQLMASKKYILAKKLDQNLFFTQSRDDAVFLAYKRINCQIADTLHPLGEKATLNSFRKRNIRDYNRWITPNVLCQQPDQPLSLLLDYMDSESSGDLHRFFHIVNIYSNESEIHHKQVLDRTLDSMIQAKNVSRNDVQHVSVHTEEDQSFVPASFLSGVNLTRTVADVENFEEKRSLPLVFDILENGTQSCQSGDFLIFTNVDICLHQNFYNAVSEFINMGFDCLTINRRTIGDIETYAKGPIVACAEVGKNHPGFDCFIIKHSTFKKFLRNNACVGVAFSMRGLLYNMVAFADKFLMLKNVGLTYHFGDDMEWHSHNYRDYTDFNEKEYKQTLITLCKQDPTIERNLKLFCQRHGEKYTPS